LSEPLGQGAADRWRDGKPEAQVTDNSDGHGRCKEAIAKARFPGGAEDCILEIISSTISFLPWLMK
jgi:hypothetical protein